MTADVPELTAHLGYWLRQVSNHVSHAFARKVAAKDVTVAEWTMMRVLYSTQPVAPSQLADEMGMTRGAISKLADRLVSKSLVTREASSTDARAQSLRLTPQGAHLVPELAALAEENEAECFAHLSSEDRATLRRILKEVVVRLEITATPIE
jgi:DNA-binding MarR family transcriptional regulator